MQLLSTNNVLVRPGLLQQPDPAPMRGERSLGWVCSVVLHSQALSHLLPRASGAWIQGKEAAVMVELSPEGLCSPALPAAGTPARSGWAVPGPAMSNSRSL